MYPNSHLKSPRRIQIQKPLPPLRAMLLCSMLLCSMLLVAGSVGAQEGESGVDIGFGLGISHSDGDTDSNLTAVSVRAHHWFSDRWGFEGAFSVTDRGVFNEDNLFLDLSGLYLLHENDRFSTFLIGGVGALEYQVQEFSTTPGGFPIDRGEDTVPTLHIGIGFEVALGERFLFRPDLRHRRHLDVVDDADDRSFDATVGFGWRF